MTMKKVQRRTKKVGDVENLLRRLQSGEATTEELSRAAAIARARVDRGDGEATRLICESFVQLWDPGAHGVPEPEPVIRDAIREQFHKLYYNVSKQTWRDTWYEGFATYKCPTDMWIYQELIHAVRPGLVIETGTWRGGSALFLAHRLDIAGFGRVVSVDLKPQPNLPQHPRVTYINGSSVAPDVVDQVAKHLPTDGSPVMVILDSDHAQHHVAGELAAFAPMVTVGSYLIVEDTNVNGHPVYRDYGPGPYEAVEDFLATDTGFEVDTRAERYYLTQNPRGYLRRVR